MIGPPGIAEFVFQLRSARSPVAKMKVLLRGWSALRVLTPAQRRDVARELGFEGAEDLVTRVAASRGSLPPAELVEALRRAGDTSPEELDGLLTELRSPEERKGLLQKGLAALESFLVSGTLQDGEASAPAVAAAVDERIDGGEMASEGSSAVAVVAAGTQVEEKVEVKDEAELPGEPAAAVVELEDKAAPLPPPPPMPAEAAPPGPAKQPASPVPPAPKEPVVAGRDLPAAVPRATAAGAPARPHEGRAARRESPEAVERQRTEPGSSGWRQEPPRVEVDVVELRGRFAELRSPLARLRLLRSSAWELRGRDVDDLAPLLAAFPEEWARRRALLALLEAGTLLTVEDAVRLVDQLESRAARRWCLATLLSLMGLNVEERRALSRREELGVVLRRRFEAGEPTAE